MSELILFWHRRDLRVSDQLGLVEARKITPKVVGFFCLDPQILQREDIAPSRLTYMIGCLQHLQESYRKLGSQLLIFQRDPVEIIPQLITTLNPRGLYFNLDGEPYAQNRDQTIISTVKNLGKEVQTFWDQLLHSPLEIKTGTGHPYTVYTPFWKNWLNSSKPQPLGDLEPLIGLTENEQENVQKLGQIPLPTAAELGFIWNRPLFLEPGEITAQNQLEKFINTAIYQYQEQRNFPAIVGTSQLSPALKFGVISIRKIWQKIQYLQAKSDPVEQQNIQIWQQELAWREFYQHALYHFPELEKGPYRNLFRNFPWENNPQHFQAWCEGKTGYPIVDAAMRQLNHTGWMHNRCRMIVASFLTKDLIINWQWGEKYFMQTLIDGDLAANNGGWQWSASSGMDPRPLRIFNPASQAEKFDPNGEYIRHWLPELKTLDTKTLFTGKLTPLEARLRGYVTPIIDHQQRQKYFKELYQQQKLIS